MNDINFFSESNYLYLPTKKNPKVAIAFNNAEVARNAFKLYNPFSTHGKILKNIASTIYVNCNTVVNKLSSDNLKSTSEFIQYLEQKLAVTLVVSIYFATEKDKVVIQLQTENKVYGYLKFPLNAVGSSRLLNEKKAIDILSKKNIVSPVLFSDQYKGNHFILLKEVKGAIELVSKPKLDALLSSFKKTNKYQLKQHPRVLQLLEKLTILGLDDYTEMVHVICNASKNVYHEVYEHGDFTPWNLITDNTDVIPFDFEYFEQYGLEYFDIIKYHFQIGRLLDQLSNRKLVESIFRAIQAPEISMLFQLFLLKEIIAHKSNNKPYLFEKELLDYIYHGKV